MPTTFYTWRLKRLWPTTTPSLVLPTCTLRPSRAYAMPVHLVLECCNCIDGVGWRDISRSRPSRVARPSKHS
ncbi:hypothetical protein C8Q70DRAFT_1030196 [Cubamyces menziesii]|nr:hypothetical protein C8Q70DRAFT_1030196 [Cubamyces menziesii]